MVCFARSATGLCQFIGTLTGVRFSMVCLGQYTIGQHVPGYLFKSFLKGTHGAPQQHQGILCLGGIPPRRSMNRQPCTDDYLRGSSSVHAGSAAVRGDRNVGGGLPPGAAAAQTAGRGTPSQRQTFPGWGMSTCRSNS